MLVLPVTMAALTWWRTFESRTFLDGATAHQGECGDENPTTLFEPLPFFHVSLELEAEAPHDTEKISMATA